VSPRAEGILVRHCQRKNRRGKHLPSQTYGNAAQKAPVYEVMTDRETSRSTMRRRRHREKNTGNPKKRNKEERLPLLLTRPLSTISHREARCP